MGYKALSQEYDRLWKCVRVRQRGGEEEEEEKGIERTRDKVRRG